MFSKLGLVLYLMLIDIIGGIDSIYLFDSHSKDENGNLSSFVTAVLLKFGTLYSLGNYRWVYYNAYPLILFFQVQFIKVHCTVNASSAIKYFLKKERLPVKRQKDLNAQRRTYDPEKKRQTDKNRYDDKKESIKQYKKNNEKMWRKWSIRQILKCNWYIKNADTMKNL